MHHLACLGVDKNYKNENIYFYMAECTKKMTKSYHASFVKFCLCYETNPF